MPHYDDAAQEPEVSLLATWPIPSLTGPLSSGSLVGGPGLGLKAGALALEILGPGPSHLPRLYYES